MIISGDKKLFGIQFEKTKSTKKVVYGYISLFVNNQEIGYFHEEVSLSAVEHQLQRLLDINMDYMSEFDSLTDEGAFEKLVSSYDEKYDNSILSLAESFDDFEIRFIKGSDQLRLLWRLGEETYFDYQKNINHEIKGSRIKLEFLKEVVYDFSRHIQLAIQP